jgi:hypothetical protein
MQRLIRARILIVVLIIGNVVLFSQLQSQAFSTVDRLQNINPTSKLATSQSTQPIAPKILGSSTSVHGASISIGGMSPDTGVYAVQWVPSGENFNSYQMFRTTSATMTVPYPTCARAYSFRVFVMAENWQLSDGHQTQNVTPHSEIFDLTMPPCVGLGAATTTTVALTCATGGTCALGDTGPGGGVVFYVAEANFTSTGSDCNTSCKYLEAEPAIIRTGTWCNVDTSIGASVRNTAIGTGMSNTNNADATCSSGAIQTALDYSRNGKIDWHLPSFDELAQLYTQRNLAGIDIGSPAVYYWSSTEQGVGGGNAARMYRFNDGATNISGGKTGLSSVRIRIIRAFG